MENYLKIISDLKNFKRKESKPVWFAFYLGGGHEESNCGVMEVSAYAMSVLPTALQHVDVCK